jgi:hypothetical protein
VRLGAALRRGGCLLVACACITKLGGAQSAHDAPTIAGCYVVAYGPWFPGAPTPRTEQPSLQPTAFELRTDIDTAPGGHGFLVSAVPREARRMKSAEPVTWRVQQPDSIVVDWDPGMLGGGYSLGGQTALRLAVHADTLRGIAEMSTDPIVLFGPPWARIIAVRTPCDTGVDARLVATREFLREWSAKQSVDTALAVARAIQYFQAQRRADPDLGVAPVSAMIRSYYTVHGRLPRSTRDAFAPTDPVIRRIPPDVVLTNAYGFPYVYHPHGRSFDLIDVGPDGVEGTSDDKAWKNVPAR